MFITGQNRFQLKLTGIFKDACDEEFSQNIPEFGSSLSETKHFPKTSQQQGK